MIGEVSRMLFWHHAGSFGTLVLLLEHFAARLPTEACRGLAGVLVGREPADSSLSSLKTDMLLPSESGWNE